MWQFPRWQQGTKENVVVMASFCCKAILALTYVAAVEVAQAVGTRPLMWGTRPPWGITKYSKTHLIQIDWIYSEQETLTEGHNIDFMQISSFNYDSNSLFFLSDGIVKCYIHICNEGKLFPLKQYLNFMQLLPITHEWHPSALFHLLVTDCN